MLMPTTYYYVDCRTPNYVICLSEENVFGVRGISAQTLLSLKLYNINRKTSNSGQFSSPDHMFYFIFLFNFFSDRAGIFLFQVN